MAVDEVSGVVVYKVEVYSPAGLSNEFQVI